MSLLDKQDTYKQIAADAADLVKRNDLLSRLSMITHIQKTIDNLEREMHQQWQMAEDIYGQMERNSLEEELGDNVMPIPSQSSSSFNSNKPLPPQ